MSDLSNGLDQLKTALAGRYDVERQLGRGGMATVYLAEDLKHHRKVAIKVLLPELAATVGSERFLQEIAVVAKLNHPHILPLIDSGDAAGLPYYVMPYVAGESLRDRLERETQLPVETLYTPCLDACCSGGRRARRNSRIRVHRSINAGVVRLQPPSGAVTKVQPVPRNGKVMGKRRSGVWSLAQARVALP